VHFDWVRDDGFRFAQAETLAKHLDGVKGPYVLLGDFNDLPESRTLALFRTRAAEAAKPADARFTFPSDAPAREIDFIFAAPASAWRATEVRVVDERVASDHRPVLAVLQRR
jgi:endonuclease/exonuclease/phosphatase family metal-dependent hydrolase